MERKYPWCNLDQVIRGLQRITGVKRSHRSVQSKAQSMLLADAVPIDYSRLAWAGIKNGKRVKTVFLYKAAHQDGVLKRQYGKSSNPWLVPTKWLDAKLRELEAGAHGYTRDEIREQWLTTAQVAAIFNMPMTRFAGTITSSRYTLRRIFDKHVRRWRDYQHAGYRFHWHPDDVHVAHREYVEYKRTRAAKNPTDNLIRNHPKENNDGTTTDSVHHHQAAAL